jgi:hypothetical protein
MKALTIFIFLIIFGSNGMFGQAAASEASESFQRVEAIDMTQRSKAEYKSAAEQWKSVVDANKSNADAWLNYYKALRFESYTDHSRKISKEKQQKLDQIISGMSTNISNSFEFEYASYLNGNKSNAALQHLKKAWSLKSGDRELLDDMIALSSIENNDGDMKQYCQLLSNANVYNAAEVEYNRNVFNSIEQNGILITHGNVDTYPLLMMQKLQNFRNDVTIICLEWLGNEKYQEKVKGWLEISSVKTVTEDKLFNHSTKRPVYFALTISPDILKSRSDQLYCTGLAFKHSKNIIENIPSLVYNWESLFSKGNIHQADAINKNYLLPMILLRDQYNLTGQTAKAEDLKQQILQISNRYSLSESTKKHID